jgi:amino acid adenylation domain-containing protein
MFFFMIPEGALLVTPAYLNAYGEGFYTPPSRETEGRKTPPYGVTDGQEHVLLLTLHHIVFDGQSVDVLMRELSVLYQAQVEGEPGEEQSPPPLPELPIQYADYTLWQRQWFQGVGSGLAPDLQEQLAYWRGQLANLSPLELPTDHPRPAAKTDRGASQSRLLPKALSLGLLRLCQELDVTLFMLLLSAFQILLVRYTGQTDICVASPVANRTRPELEGLIGFFANTLVLRTDLSGNPTFEQVLQRVREVCLSAYVNQDIPFEKVVEALEPERDLSHSPLFQVVLVLQQPLLGNETTRPQLLRAPSFPTITPLSVQSTTSKFDLTLYVAETGQGLHCTCEYSTDLFEAKTITRMLGHLQTLLEGLLQSPQGPQARLFDLPLLPGAEREQLLVQWNETKTDYLRDLSVHQLFEQQVERSSDAVALVFEDQILTYDLLNRRSNQFARHLQKLGVGPEVLVGICMERCIEMVIGLLAILKAGGASVPLDPTHPQERLAFMLADAQVRLLLTQEHLCTQWSLMDVPILCLDTNWVLIAEQSEENLQGSVEAENLAYVIYTSGSTGYPKGVEVQRDTLLNLLLWFCDEIGLMALDRVLLMTSLGFDSSQKNIFAPLIVGGTLHLPALPYYDSTAILQIIFLQSITVVNCTPSAFYPLIEGLNEEDLVKLQCLRSLLLGGEPLAIQRLWRWITSPFCRAHISNVYGLTECGDITTSYSLEPSRQSVEASVPIGRPIRNGEVFVLDKELQPVPIGIPGELYIGGTGLARGYLGRAELTAQCFVPHPFVGTRRGWGRTWVSSAGVCPGERLYRTGDLARYRADGTIEYLGRTDHQIKLRGYRIELGEIESVLHQHPAVNEVIVLAHEGHAGEKQLAPTATQLVAYIVLNPVGTGVSSAKNGRHQNEKPLSAPAHHAVGIVGTGQRRTPKIPTHETAKSSDFRKYLQTRLPNYMIPSLFVLLDSLPLSHNGKVDRQALPRPDFASLSSHEEFVALKTPEEVLLGQIWADVLWPDAEHTPVQLGAYSNFFELGGHSLLAVQLLNRINQWFGVSLPLPALFQFPTIAQIAPVVQNLRLQQHQHTDTLPAPSLVVPLRTHLWGEQNAVDPSVGDIGRVVGS